jgi:hypothetical protein
MYIKFPLLYDQINISRRVILGITQLVYAVSQAEALFISAMLSDRNTPKLQGPRVWQQK